MLESGVRTGKGRWVDLFPDWRAGLTRILRTVSPVTGEDTLTEPESDLYIDDVIVSKSHNHINLDVRLRNAGKAVVNVTRADLHVLGRVPYAAAYQASASYDLLLESENNSIAVAHVLQPNEVDRFNVRVGFTRFNTSCHFEAELILHFNNDRRVASQPFTLESLFRN